jgi:hypothetical protein
MTTELVVAIIGGVTLIFSSFLGYLGVVVNKNRDENIRDHSKVISKLDCVIDDIAELDNDVKGIGSKLEQHLDDHDSGAVEKRPRRIGMRLKK